MAQPLGLTLGYFHCFIDIHGGRSAFQGLTTAQVCFQFVVPFTTESRLSQVDHVLNTNDADCVKPATWYVSHAWSYIFLEVIESLDYFFADKDEPVLWFCVFANNQHRAAEMPFTWWQTTFRQSLEAIGNVLMILHPWDNPVTLTRSWCVFEVYVSIVVNANFQVAMASNQATVFMGDLLTDLGSFHNMLSCVNSKDAKSTVASNKESIDQVIEAEVGFVALDRMVLEKFEKWMRETLNERIASSACDLDKAEYLKTLEKWKLIHVSFDDALIDATKAYAIYVDELGPDDPRTLSAQGIQSIVFGYLTQQQSTWEPVLVDVIAKLEKTLGEYHDETLECMTYLGMFYKEQSPTKAMDMLGIVYSRLNEIYGPMACKNSRQNSYTFVLKVE
ncbi:hypothetical protein THRCLA_08723 [Thraustotheca clavata]|uniref:Uncharacterized protein n=1 Tax=Thraustotheca clavata TaxID=74557 RepID=A0A1V9Z3G4_9STRA|nr:hypothetical protein THRCLA_08723 [Thraustotheca clavata]